jgi:hypothetical protein
MARALPEEKFRGDEPAPRRRMGFFTKLFLFLLLIAAGWFAWYSYRAGGIPDVTSRSVQDKMLKQAREDLEVGKEKAVELGGQAAEGARKAADWASRSIDDLRKRIKGKPPETSEEVTTLVKDSGSDTKAIPPQPPEPAPPTASKPAPANAWDATLEEARNEYYRGVAEHAKSDPSFSRDQVQAALRAAAPHFARTLDLLEEVRAKGGAGSEIADLEHKTAVRLYDCRKRLAVK